MKICYYSSELWLMKGEKGVGDVLGSMVSQIRDLAFICLLEKWLPIIIKGEG